MKEIWILNHYASATSGRHYNFARLLNERGYSVKLFAASTVHGVGNNRIHGKDKKFTLDDESGVPCIYVRTRAILKWCAGSLTWLTMPWLMFVSGV